MELLGTFFVVFVLCLNGTTKAQPLSLAMAYGAITMVLFQIIYFLFYFILFFWVIFLKGNDFYGWTYIRSSF
jgi:hypothetical protein